MSKVVVKTSEEWSKLFPYDIIDADGWDRGNFEYSWHIELITFDEFCERAMMSTMMPRYRRN